MIGISCIATASPRPAASRSRSAGGSPFAASSFSRAICFWKRARAISSMPKVEISLRSTS